jgi:hypothetical protein
MDVKPLHHGFPGPDRSHCVDLPGNVALEAADDLGLGLALGGAALDVLPVLAWKRIRTITMR